MSSISYIASTLTGNITAVNEVVAELNTAHAIEAKCIENGFSDGVLFVAEQKNKAGEIVNVHLTFVPAKLRKVTSATMLRAIYKLRIACERLTTYYNGLAVMDKYKERIEVSALKKVLSAQYAVYVNGDGSLCYGGDTALSAAAAGANNFRSLTSLTKKGVRAQLEKVFNGLTVDDTIDFNAPAVVTLLNELCEIYEIKCNAQHRICVALKNAIGHVDKITADAEPVDNNPTISGKKSGKKAA